MVSGCNSVAIKYNMPKVAKIRSLYIFAIFPEKHEG